MARHSQRSRRGSVPTQSPPPVGQPDAPGADAADEGPPGIWTLGWVTPAAFPANGAQYELWVRVPPATTFLQVNGAVGLLAPLQRVGTLPLLNIFEFYRCWDANRLTYTDSIIIEEVV